MNSVTRLFTNIKNDDSNKLPYNVMFASEVLISGFYVEIC